MPGIRNHREFTTKQKTALEKRQKNRENIYGPLMDPGADPLPVSTAAAPVEKSMDKVLNDYLVIYDARLLEIDHKYPLGDPDRPEWLEVHRKNGAKRLKEITQSKTEIPKHA